VVGYRCPEISSEWEQEMLAFVVGGVQIYVNSTFVTANLVAGNPKYGLASALHLLATNIWQVLSHRRCGPRTITAYNRSFCTSLAQSISCGSTSAA
jgi:hypothetical protein